MTRISEANFIVIDIETNGSNPIVDRITDVACVSIKNNEIVSVYSSLINPHQHIPSFIQNMTGITDEMVSVAPEVDNIIPIVRDFLTHQNAYFVAHNYGFDWKFIAETIKRAGLLLPEVEKICTLKLARKTVARSIKRNVGSLSEYFNIPIVNRHRALDDAFATACFFIEILQILKDKYDIHYVEEILEFQDKRATYPPKLDLKISEKISHYKEILPMSYGVLKFIDNNKKTIHITKTNNLREHFLTYTEQIEVSSKKVTTILKNLHHLEWIEVETELETSIIFQKQIRQYRPKYNLLDVIECETFDILNLKSNNTTSDSAENIKQTLVLLLPNFARDKTIDIYFLYESQLRAVETVGQKSKLDDIFIITRNIYFIKTPITSSDTNYQETKIIKNWIKKYEKISKIIYVSNKTEVELLAELEKTIRQFYLM